MSLPINERLVEQLSLHKSEFSAASARLVMSILGQLRRLIIRDAETLTRYHETLLFLRAYPQASQILTATEAELRNFHRRVELLRDQEIDLSHMEHPELSGISGHSVSDTFSFDIVRWLVKKHLKEITVDWDWFEAENRLADAWPRFMPLMEEDTLVEANIPYREWLKRARKGTAEIQWLIARFENLPIAEKEKAELYNAQQLYVRWTPNYRSTRTGLRAPDSQPIFYQRRPLISRREVQLSDEVRKPVQNLELLSPNEGNRALDLARDASTVRYRELYGFTHGDPACVMRVALDRGLSLHIVGLPSDRRLPLRAYHAAMIYRNSVPVGYFEGLSLCDRMESGFNLYYTFREGETAWIYAQTLKVMRHLTGVSAFSLDPYQIGYENKEGIESGAFWFYRKLGFRSTNATLRRLTTSEEKKLAAKTKYRTSGRTLRQLAQAPMIFELDEHHLGDWDRFQIRNIGLHAQDKMAQAFKGDAVLMKSKAVKLLERWLNLDSSILNKSQQRVFADFAIVLSLISDLQQWKAEEKQQVISIIKAKAGVDERRYLREMQSHDKLRHALIRLGS
ncbi:MAG TPA: hypothetical protein VLB68_32055 [Pyrinomonadaceae bacterium]|nr:hypothetical protein [Pyrinomonadaceae bacterium]